MKTKLTCIIPTHLRDKLLKDAIDSVVKQTCKPFELIVVDNTNSQATKELVVSYRSKTEILIRYIGHSQGGKGCISRNIGAQSAQGNVLAFLDDDDMWAPNYIESMLEIKQHDAVNAVYGWLMNFVNGKQYPGKTVKQGLKSVNFVLSNPGTVISNLVIDRDTFLDINGFDENIHPPHDKDLIIRLLRKGYRYSVLKEPLVFFRQHEGPRESMFGLAFARGQWALYEKHKDWMPLHIRIAMWIKAVSCSTDREFLLPVRTLAYILRIARYIWFGSRHRLQKGVFKKWQR